MWHTATNRHECHLVWHLLHACTKRTTHCHMLHGHACATHWHVLHGRACTTHWSLLHVHACITHRHLEGTACIAHCCLLHLLVRA